MQLDFGLELKSVTEAGHFEGLASTYGNIDSVRDVVLPGAFTKSLASRGAECPILWTHDQSQPVGLGVLSDSAKGLMIRGELDLDIQVGRDAHSRLTKRIVRGLSIGYTLPPGGADFTKDGIRQLKEIDLREVSLVAVPCNDQARVTAVKSLAGIRDFERFLCGSGWSRSEARKLAAKGWLGLDGADDEPSDDEALSWLRAQRAR